ncbi:MAG: K+-transporting ATPase, A chain [Rhodobacterales bacterium]|nr:MAG: K+-transporting ATPase, A chain [Rhodobacterales bacterium]
MSGLRRVYLGFAIIGAVVPMIYFAQWFGEYGVSLSGLIEGWRANAASRGAAMDRLMSGIALTVWILAETSVRRNWSALWAIPATFCIGVSCGLPLYLFLRTRPV